MKLRARAKHLLYGSLPGFAGRFPYFGTRVHFPKGSKSFLAACQQGIYEADVALVLKRTIRDGTYMFDVGGNIGLMALPVLSSCQTCKVVSFEPSPSSLPYLRRTVAESKYSDRWHVIDKALSESEGELTFAVGKPSESLFEGFRSGGRIAGATNIVVPVTTLDLEWDRLGRPEVSVVKIDVEGAEMLVLGGASRLLSGSRPYVVFEWNSDYIADFETPAESVLDLAHRFGYRVFSIPYGVPILDLASLEVQMMFCSDFVLSPGDVLTRSRGALA